MIDNFYTTDDRSLRIYSHEELQVLDPEITGTLYALEQYGLIDPQMREDIVDAVLLHSGADPLSPGEFNYLVFDHLLELLPPSSHFGLHYVLFDRKQPQVLQ